MRIFLLITVILAAVIGFGCGEEAASNNASTNKPANKPGPSSPSNVNTSGQETSNSNEPITYPQNAAANVMTNAGSASNSGYKEEANSAANLPAANNAANNVGGEKKKPRVLAKATSSALQENQLQAEGIEKKDESLFSFPPPKPTSFVILDINKLVDRQQPASFGKLGGQLSAALKNAGYSSEEFSYFWNNSDEFAIVTKMERITPDGSPLLETRWDDSEQFPVVKSFWDYPRFLICGKKVYYRVFAFVVTSKNYNFYKSSPPSFEVARDWMSKGFSILGGDSPANPNPGVENIELSPEHHCYALLYLFVNHTSLDQPKSVDKLEGMEEGLKTGLNEEAQKHLCQTGIISGDCNQ